MSRLVGRHLFARFKELREGFMPGADWHHDLAPSSTWTQSMGQMPIGYFCDEPEAQAAVQKPV